MNPLYEKSKDLVLIRRTSDNKEFEEYPLIVHPQSALVTDPTNNILCFSLCALHVGFATSASYSTTSSYANTASFAFNSITSSWAWLALSASFANSSSYAISSSYAAVAEAVLHSSAALSASYASTASLSLTSSNPLYLGGPWQTTVGEVYLYSPDTDTYNSIVVNAMNDIVITAEQGNITFTPKGYGVNPSTVTITEGTLMAPFITGSLFGTSSYALTASYAKNAGGTQASSSWASASLSSSHSETASYAPNIVLSGSNFIIWDSGYNSYVTMSIVNGAIVITSP